MKIAVLKNETYNDSNTLPKTGTDRSTGYDIFTTSDPEIVGTKSEYGYSNIEYIQYKTNLKVSIQKSSTTMFVEAIDYDLFVMPRSSISKYNLILANSIGLIDADYRGEILLRFKYIWQPSDYSIITKDYISSIVGNPDLSKIYKKGDKICQLKATKVEHIDFYLEDVLDDTVRSNGGFGSTNTPNPTLLDALKNYKTPVYTPEKKYSDLIKERENKL